MQPVNITNKSDVAMLSLINITKKETNVCQLVNKKQLDKSIVYYKINGEQMSPRTTSLQ